MIWIAKHPRANMEMLGWLSGMLCEDDIRPAAEQFDTTYRHGGGWQPTSGFTMKPNGNLQYPGDRPTRLLYETKLHDETIRFYENAWVAIIQPNGDFEVCRMD